MFYVAYFLVLNVIGLALGSLFLELAGRRISRKHPELNVDDARSSWINGLAIGFFLSLSLYWLVQLWVG